MYDDKKILAVIPARSGSKGLPGKNIMSIAGHPLIAWSIQAAKKSKYIDRIIVSTDCTDIASVAKTYGADIPFMRPAELAADDSSSIDVLLHSIESVEDRYDYLVLLEPTSPLREVKDIDLAIEMLINNSNNASSIVGVCQIEATHPAFSVKIKQDGLIEPYMGKGFQPPRRQEIESLYFLEGTIYISNINDLISKKTFYHEKTMTYIVPKWKSFEIDDEVDMICCEAILKKRNRNDF